MNILRKIIAAVNRFKRARNLGFTFFRTKSFSPPSIISFLNKRLPLFLPDEEGVTELFRDIILDDEYWLELIPENQVNTVLDVGANIVIFALAARIRFSQACIYAYEPKHSSQAIPR